MKPLGSADHIMNLTWEARDGGQLTIPVCAYCGASVNYCTGEGSPRHLAKTKLREQEAKEAIAATDNHDMELTWDLGGGRLHTPVCIHCGAVAALCPGRNIAGVLNGFDEANARLGEQPPGWLVTSYVGVELITRAFTDRKDAEAHARELAKDGTTVLLSEVKVLFVTKVVPVCLTEIELEVKL